MLCVWTASSEVAGVRGWPWGRVVDIAGSFSGQVASVVNDSPTCPVSSGALPCTFLPWGQTVLQISNGPWALISPGKPAPAASFISELRVLGSSVRSPAWPPPRASLASWLCECVPTLRPSLIPWLPLAEVGVSVTWYWVIRLSQLVSSSQTSFSFNSSETSLSDS